MRKWTDEELIAMGKRAVSCSIRIDYTETGFDIRWVEDKNDREFDDEVELLRYIMFGADSRDVS